MTHVIKYAESGDGHAWQKAGLSVPYQLGEAQAFSRPTVWIDRLGGYHMWYSYRSGTGELYRIGYATSLDGLLWTRQHDKSDLGVSSSGWDSTMIEYPFVQEFEGQLQLFYNGNSFGKTGFGVAVSGEVKNEFGT